VVIDHALRIAGGAGRVVERDRAAFIGDRAPGKVRIAAGDELFILDPAEALARPAIERIVDVDHQWRFLQPRERRADLGGVFAIGDQHLRLAVLEDIADGRGIEPRVDGVKHRAEHRHAEMHLEHRRHVRQHRRYRLARTHMVRQRGRKPCDPFAQRPVAQPQVAVYDRKALRMDRGGSRQEGNRRQRREIRRVGLQAGEQAAVAPPLLDLPLRRSCPPDRLGCSGCTRGFPPGGHG
jgi:hypothetical protein